MKKFMFLCLMMQVFFSDCMSTQNRRIVSELDQRQIILDELCNRGLEGDDLAQKSYETYLALLFNEFTMDFYNKRIQEKLVSLDLCVVEDGCLKIKSYEELGN